MLLQKNKTIESFLPVFNGFYNSIFEPTEDTVIESPYSFDDYEFDYKGYKDDVARECTKTISDKLIEFGIKGVKIKYQLISSPKYYNFETDSIYVKYSLTNIAVKAINKYLIDNKDAFTKYIKDHYTSRDGFNSWHSNDANEWLQIKLSDKKELTHAFGAILEFIFENENYTAFNLYEDIADNVYLSGWLKDGIVETDTYITQYATDKYKTKDITTITGELVEYFEANEIEHDFLTYGYIEDKVLNIFNETDSNTIDMFKKVK